MKLVAFLIVVFTFAYADEILTRVTQVFGDIEKKQLNNMDIFLGSEAILVDAQVGKVVEKIIQFPKPYAKQHPNLYIQAIAHFDNLPTPSTMKILSGGIRKNNVTLQVQSMPGQKIESHIRFYGRIRIVY